MNVKAFDWAKGATCLGIFGGGAIFLALSISSQAAQTAATLPPVKIVADRFFFSRAQLADQPAANGPNHQIRSLLNIRTRMQFGDYVWNDDNVPRGPVWVRVDLSRQIISVFRADHEIGSAVILYGTDGHSTPSGSFPILERAVLHRSSSYDAEMPYMLRLTRDGVAIHASNVQRGSATHGCIGIPLPFARLLYGETKKGDPVVIVNS